MFFYNQAIRQLQSRIAQGNARVQALKEERMELTRSFNAIKSSFTVAALQFFNGQLLENKDKADKHLDTLSPYNKPAWEAEAWNAWEPQKQDIHTPLYFGLMTTPLPDTDQVFGIPTIMDFIGHNKCVIVESGPEECNDVYAFFQSMALRINARLLHNVNFTFIDPSGFGKAFPIARQLNTRVDSGDLFRLLEEIGRDITRINQTYGLSDDRMFDSIADAVLINEKFEVIFVANFLKDYDRRVIEKLLKIAEQGPVAGKYVFIHHNTCEELPRDISLDGIANAHRVAISGDEFSWKMGNRQSIPLYWWPDEKPTDEITDLVIKKIKSSIPKENPIDWKAIKPANYWKETATQVIETTVGISGNRSPLNIWFGHKHSEDSRECSHAILAGMTGSGKSNFYHAFILSLACRYSPEEVSLYLIDGKDGVEFQDYKQLPHAAVVSLKSLPGLSRSILSDLTEEIARRNKLFSEEYGVDKYENFRLKSGGKLILPRILLIVDEYQELLEGDVNAEASAHLRLIAEKGRSAGIHMLLGSQRFGAANLMYAASIFANIEMRIAMKLSLSDRLALTEFGKEGKDLLANCDLPGKVVVNDRGGNDGHNKLGKVAIIKKDDRLQVIAELTAKSMEQHIPPELLITNIFNGTEQPHIIDNTQLAQLLNHNHWMDKQEMEQFARKEIYHGGIGEIGWFSGETPFVFWLGQEFNVRGHSNVVTRRRQRENVLIIGDNNDARYGIMFGILSSAVLNAPNTDVHFYIADKSIPGAPWSNVLPNFCNGLIQEMKYRQQFAGKNTEVINMLQTLTAEVAARKDIPEEERPQLPTIIFMAADLDRIDSLNLQMNKYGSPEETEAGKMLRQVITEGPALGIHAFISFEGVLPMYNVFNKRNLEFFRHRVALQMSEQDAFDLVRRREASRLQAHGNKPIAAFYIDIGSNKSSVFKPYIVSKGMSETFVKEIAKKLVNG
ncbi:DNA translocase FtsK [Chitinophaga agrisoli]|uniref:DNA translocase FtsK n=1 Tax=Chitinophaga agrisoli TaxID=2607653 RepID=A0A5B2VLX6_9BACT|nr:FtsK/SpoIIIE domain-containing protein [Chitinophaga agrisoli]KAA2239219.1 DNA translocase FtsK [Chitinophaga agrisoli]